MDTATCSTKRRVLIVDDDIRIVEIISAGLSDLAGYEVYCYASGMAAREALSRIDFDMVITDWSMPDVDGLTLVREAHQQSHRTITVLMTGFGSPDFRVHAKKAGADHYLEKPFFIDDVIRIVESAFPPPLAPAPAVRRAPVFKVILGGDANVGKTSLIQRYCTGRFEPGRSMTIGIDFHAYEAELETTNARLVVWDLGGQDRFAPARRAFYKGTRAVGLVFDASNRNSFYNLMRWWREVRENLQGIPILLLANKTDLPRQVSREETAGLAAAWGIPFFESSCATGAGVAEFFRALALQAWQSSESQRPAQWTQSV